jgi:hypothetical protein
MALPCLCSAFRKRHKKKTLNSLQFHMRSRDSSVGITTRLLTEQLRNQGSIPIKEETFLHGVQISSVAYETCCRVCIGARRPGREADHPLLSNIETYLKATVFN